MLAVRVAPGGTVAAYAVTRGTIAANRPGAPPDGYVHDANAETLTGPGVLSLTVPADFDELEQQLWRYEAQYSGTDPIDSASWSEPEPAFLVNLTEIVYRRVEGDDLPPTPPDEDAGLLPNVVPVVANPIPTRNLVFDQIVFIDLDAVFSDPGDRLTYTVTSESFSGNALIVSDVDAGFKRFVDPAGRLLRLRGGGGPGDGSCTVKARDTRGAFVTDTFAVNVTNAAPVVSNPIPTQNLVFDQIVFIDLDAVFSDPGDRLTYTVVSESFSGNALIGDNVPGRPFTDPAGSDLRLRGGGGPGNGSCTVRATDRGGLSVTDTFAVNVGAP